MSDDTTNTNYYAALPPATRTKLEAGAFASLCSHLRDRSDAVQNMDLMALSGFCRNCLAKWLVLEARKMSAELLQQQQEDDNTNINNGNNLIQALDALGYDETAEHVYGCTYPEWKRRHATKATDEQMDRYNASKPLHAAHDKDVLKVKAERPSPVVADDDNTNAAASNSRPAAVGTPTSSGNGGTKSSLLSDVCCEDVESAAAAAMCRPTTSSSAAKPTVPPPDGEMSVNIGILTVSDRAAAGQYETGDLSGPAVEHTLGSLVDGMNHQGGNIIHRVTNRGIVPDDMDDIAAKLREWSAPGVVDACDLIFTTGGTGFSPRDVTPEATRSVLDKESQGLMAWVSSECSGGQPLAALSRGTAGMLGHTLIVNLPGSPAGVKQTMVVACPLLLHAVKDIKTA